MLGISKRIKKNEDSKSQISIYKKASMTVELSLLMPFILGVFLFIVFMAFYLHDRCLTNKIYAVAALRASLCESENMIEPTAMEAIEEQGTSFYTGIWELTPSVFYDGEIVTVKGSGNMKLTRGLLALLIDYSKVDYCLETKAFYIDEVKHVRNIRREI